MPNEIKNFIVEELKTRLDKFLAGEFSDLSRSKIQRAIELGFVKVNGEAVTVANHTVRKGDNISYEVVPEEVIEPKNIPLHTL